MMLPEDQQKVTVWAAIGESIKFLIVHRARYFRFAWIFALLLGGVFTWADMSPSAGRNQGAGVSQIIASGYLTMVWMRFFLLGPDAISLSWRGFIRTPDGREDAALEKAVTKGFLGPWAIFFVGLIVLTLMLFFLGLVLKMGVALALGLGVVLAGVIGFFSVGLLPLFPARAMGWLDFGWGDAWRLSLRQRLPLLGLVLALFFGGSLWLLVIMAAVSPLVPELQPGASLADQWGALLLVFAANSIVSLFGVIVTWVVWAACFSRAFLQLIDWRAGMSLEECRASLVGKGFMSGR